MADSCARGCELDTDAHNASGGAPRLFPLSDDVLVCAFELLGLSDLRSVAGVSQQFYAASWRSGLYIHLKNRAVLNPRDPRAGDREAESWSALVDQALRKNLRVAFTLYGRRALGVSPADILPLLRKLLCAVTKSLPILVSLSIIVEGVAYPELCAALQNPAPFLRCLFIRSFANDDVAIGPIRPSDDLFAGNAPLLCDLGLELRSVGPAPVPAFGNVTRFSTSRIGKHQQVSLSRHFPRLRHLMVASDAGEECQVPPPQIGVAGIQLRSLVFYDTAFTRLTPFAERKLTVPCPPVFHHLIDRDDRLSSRALLGWPWNESGRSAIEMHVTFRRELGRNFRYADGTWRRSFMFRSLRSSAAPYSLPGLPGRLTYLRMDHSALGDLLPCVSEFAALSRLRVDVVCEKTVTSKRDPLTVRFFDDNRLLDIDIQLRNIDFRLRCPVLESLSVLWYTCAPAGPVTLDRDSILVLGRALVTDAKPVLELGDVDRERPLVLADASEDGSAALEDVFAAVRRVPCAFGVLLDQFDGDGWNDNAAIVEEKFLSQILSWELSATVRNPLPVAHEGQSSPGMYDLRVTLSTYAAVLAVISPCNSR